MQVRVLVHRDFANRVTGFDHHGAERDTAGVVNARVVDGDTEKASRVRGVFDSVASRYDVMNDLMSMGLHRAWKAYTVQVANLKEGDQVLDIAGGTGDLSKIGRASCRERVSSPV